MPTKYTKQEKGQAKDSGKKSPFRRSLPRKSGVSAIDAKAKMKELGYDYSKAEKAAAATGKTSTTTSPFRNRLKRANEAKATTPKEDKVDPGPPRKNPSRKRKTAKDYASGKRRR